MVKSTVEISQDFMAFSEYMNFTTAATAVTNPANHFLILVAPHRSLLYFRHEKTIAFINRVVQINLE